jgi:nucleoside-diphosphate-sugar epimerase
LARILVTGAAGFIGRALCRGLVDRGHFVRGITRHPTPPLPCVELHPIGEINRQTDWSGHLDHIDIVIHLANRAHRAARDASRQHDEAEAARALARAAASSGLRRLIHFSSIRAMGDATPHGAPFRCTDPPLPRDPYGRGKLAIEHALRAVAHPTGLELVTLRPPLVYGPGVKGNFRALLKLVASGLPLPFAAVDNQRSLIFIDNLIDFAAGACLHAGAVGRVLLPRDATDWSTPELLRILAGGLERPVRLFAVPQVALTALRRVPLLGVLVARLTLSLQIDDRETRAALDWRPPVPSEIGLAVTARSFRDQR